MAEGPTASRTRTSSFPPIPPGITRDRRLHYAGDAPVPVTRALVDAFLARTTTQARIVAVVKSRSPEKRQRADIQRTWCRTRTSRR